MARLFLTKLARDLAESGTSSMLGRQYVSHAMVPSVAGAIHVRWVGAHLGYCNSRKVGGCHSMGGGAEVGG